jgi:hypothetical protein
LRKNIYEAAGKEHDSSEEDEIHIDTSFVETSNKLIRDLITDNISKRKIEEVEAGIREHRYLQVKEAGALGEDTLYQLGFKQRNDPVQSLMACENVSDVSMIMDTQKLGDALTESKRRERSGNRILKTAYTSKQTKAKMLRQNNNSSTNNKSYDLTGQSIHDDQGMRFNDYIEG